MVYQSPKVMCWSGHQLMKSSLCETVREMILWFSENIDIHITKYHLSSQSIQKRKDIFCEKQDVRVTTEPVQVSLHVRT